MLFWGIVCQVISLKGTSLFHFKDIKAVSIFSCNSWQEKEEAQLFYVICLHSEKHPNQLPAPFVYTVYSYCAGLAVNSVNA